MTQPHIVGIGGTPSPGSSTEQALKLALAAAEAEGARVTLFDGSALAKLPLEFREVMVMRVCACSSTGSRMAIIQFSPLRPAALSGGSATSRASAHQ